ncbi:MAG: hypothetical protein PHE67_00325 [Campylobacterales bacterium]|nr:hypothetical protein [Campylobacterales bacterium]
MIKPIVVFIDSRTDVNALLRRLGVESYEEVTRQSIINTEQCQNNLVYRMDFCISSEVDFAVSVIDNFKNINREVYFYVLGVNKRFGKNLQSAFELLPSKKRFVFVRSGKIIEPDKLTDCMKVENGVITVSFKSSELNIENREPDSAWECDNEETEVLPAGTIAVLEFVNAGFGESNAANIEVLLEKDYTASDALNLLEVGALDFLRSQGKSGLRSYYIENIVRDGNRAIFEWGT